MIKLKRGERPKELTKDICDELTRVYMSNTDNDVWNAPKIKEPLRNALLEMSHQKCAYCECTLGIESKDVTIDHFLPKSTNPEKVVEWENLFPVCLRCNREKRDHEEPMIDPCKMNPKDYLGLSSVSRYRFVGIDKEKIGKNTLKFIKLNDIDRLMIPRMRAWEKLKEYLLDIEDDMKEHGVTKKYCARFERIMKECMEDKSYSAVKATNMLADETYQHIKCMIVEADWWTDKMEEFEKEMRRIALHFV